MTDERFKPIPQEEMTPGVATRWTSSAASSTTCGARPTHGRR